jgi:DNA-binding NarL/FixJ family response regulator
MGLPISSSFSSLGATASVEAANAATPAQGTAPAATPQQLTESQQIVQLYNQGQPVSLIASTLSLPVETVNSYLGLTPTA